MFRKLNEADLSIPVLTLTIDGLTVDAESGDSIAAVLLRQNPPFSRTTPVNDCPRTPYCMMGVCFDCLAIVDGVASTQTCLVQVHQGLRVERQYGRRKVIPVVSSENDLHLGDLKLNKSEGTSQ